MTDLVPRALSEGPTAELVTGMSPDDLHRFVLAYNWDDGPEPLRWVVGRSDCDLGTALCTYWLSEPPFFSEPTHDSSQDPFEPLRTWLLQRIMSGAHTRRLISVDPTAFAQNRMQLELLRRKGVPEVLLRPTPGTAFAAS